MKVELRTGRFEMGTLATEPSPSRHDNDQGPTVFVSNRPSSRFSPFKLVKKFCVGFYNEALPWKSSDKTWANTNDGLIAKRDLEAQLGVPGRDSKATGVDVKHFLVILSRYDRREHQRTRSCVPNARATAKYNSKIKIHFLSPPLLHD